MHHDKFGIYINVREGKALRINSPYWIPEGEDWVFLTPETNCTLVRIRELAREKDIVRDPAKISWGDFGKVARRD